MQSVARCLVWIYLTFDIGMRLVCSYDQRRALMSHCSQRENSLVYMRCLRRRACVLRGIVSKKIASFRHLMNKKNQRCDDGNVVAVMRLVNPATTKRDNLFDPTIFVNAPTSDSAKIGLAMKTTMALRLMVTLIVSIHEGSMMEVI